MQPHRKNWINSWTMEVAAERGKGSREETQKHLSLLKKQGHVIARHHAAAALHFSHPRFPGPHAGTHLHYRLPSVSSLGGGGWYIYYIITNNEIKKTLPSCACTTQDTTTGHTDHRGQPEEPEGGHHFHCCPRVAPSTTDDLYLVCSNGQLQFREQTHHLLFTNKVPTHSLSQDIHIQSAP